MRNFTTLIALIFFTFSCSTDPDDSTADVGFDTTKFDSSRDSNNDPSADVSDVSEDSNSADLTVDTDTGANDIGTDADAGLPGSTDVALSGPIDVKFLEGYWGADEAPNTFIVEVMADGTGSCPTLVDPAPLATMIMKIDANGAEPVVTSTTLLDFEGNILADSVQRSLNVTITDFEFTNDVVRFAMEGNDPQMEINVVGEVVTQFCASFG